MARVYVGNLPMDMSRADVEGLFSNFKPVDVDLKVLWAGAIHQSLWR
jgi:hypothetical protein